MSFDSSSFSFSSSKFSFASSTWAIDWRRDRETDWRREREIAMLTSDGFPVPSPSEAEAAGKLLLEAKSRHH